MGPTRLSQYAVFSIYSITSGILSPKQKICVRLFHSGTVLQIIYLTEENQSSFIFIRWAALTKAVAFFFTCSRWEFLSYCYSSQKYFDGRRLQLSHTELPEIFPTSIMFYRCVEISQPCFCFHPQPQKAALWAFLCRFWVG